MLLGIVVYRGLKVWTIQWGCTWVDRGPGQGREAVSRASPTVPQDLYLIIRWTAKLCSPVCWFLYWDICIQFRCLELLPSLWFSFGMYCYIDLKHSETNATLQEAQPVRSRSNLFPRGWWSDIGHVLLTSLWLVCGYEGPGTPLICVQCKWESLGYTWRFPYFVNVWHLEPANVCPLQPAVVNYRMARVGLPPINQSFDWGSL